MAVRSERFTKTNLCSLNASVSRTVDRSRSYSVVATSLNERSICCVVHNESFDSGTQ